MAEVRKGVGVKVTVAEEMASRMVAEAMGKGVGVKVVVTVTVAEEMAAAGMVAVAYWT